MNNLYTQNQRILMLNFAVISCKIANCCTHFQSDKCCLQNPHGEQACIPYVYTHVHIVQQSYWRINMARRFIASTKTLAQVNTSHHLLHHKARYPNEVQATFRYKLGGNIRSPASILPWTLFWWVLATLLSSYLSPHSVASMRSRKRRMALFQSAGSTCA